MRIRPRYESIALTAIVAGVFSAFVGVVLVVGLLGGRAQLPLDEPQYLALTSQLGTGGDDPAIQQQLRALDVQLRAGYFRQQTFARRGALLLAGGLAATTLLWQWAFVVRRRLPQPRAAQVTDHQTRQNRRAQWACGAVLLSLACIIYGWKAAHPSVLAGSLDQLDRDESQIAAKDTGGPETEVDSRPPQSADRVTGSADQVTGSADQVAGSVDQAAANVEQAAAAWDRFRGPHGAGISPFKDLPQQWSGATGEGILWKTAVPLPGANSPIVWGQRVFLTGANQQERAVYCFDANSGELLWQKLVDASGDEPSELRVDQTTGFAAPTPATDGQRVYAIFANGDVAAFDFSGQEVWCLSLGVPDNPYGHAASLVMWKDLLIIQLDQGQAKDNKSKLLALRGMTGEVAWQVARGVPASWSTPIVVEFEGQGRIIACSDPWVIAYAADDGAEIWRAKCLEGDVGPSPVYDAGVVYVANDSAAAAAIRDGGQGDVTDSHVLWTADIGLPDICSPLVSDQQLLLVASYGDLVCYDREQGGEEPLWEEALDDSVIASPSLVGDTVYLLGEQGKGWVVRAGAAGMEQIAENDLGEPCVSSPAFQPGRIYIRGKEHLFCIGAD